MNPQSTDKKKSLPPHNMMGAGIAIGAGIGVALGVALDNIAVGIAIGMGVGIAFGAAGARKRKESEKNDKPVE